MARKKRHYKDALGRNRSLEEIAEDLGLSAGRSREVDGRESYTLRNAGQGQVPLRETKND